MKMPKKNIESDNTTYKNNIQEINILIKLHCFDNAIEVRDSSSDDLEFFIDKREDFPENYIKLY